jgi:type II secretory pathway pseudopilin PulG
MKKNAFGIVEVLVAIGLVSIMGVGITSMLTGAMKSQKGIQAKDQQREITSEVRNLLNDPIACRNSFLNGNPSGTSGFTKNYIYDAASVIKYEVDKQDKTGLLLFKEFRINNFQPDVGSPNEGRADLKIKLSKFGSTGTVGEIRPDVITLKVSLSGGVISNCFSIGMATDGFWQSTPSNLNNIYYNVGSVGIGTNNPRGALDVNGAIRLKAGASNGADTSTNGIAFENNGDTGMFLANWAGSVFAGELNLEVNSVPRISIESSSMNILLNPTASAANVGIGTLNPRAKLDVNGAIRPGYFSVGSSCGSNPEGSLAYDLGIHKPIYCNNSGSWSQMSGGSLVDDVPNRDKGINDGGAGFFDYCPDGTVMTGVYVWNNRLRIKCKRVN